VKPRDRMRRLLSNLPVKVVCLAAAVILFMFNRINTMTERFFSVPLAVEVPAGFAISSSCPSTVRVTLRGQEQAINPVLPEDIAASLNLEGHQAAGTFRVPVTVQRAGTALGVEPLEIRVEPQVLTVALEPLAERRVPVVPDVTGSPAHGYELASFEVAPRAVAIRGPRSRVQAVPSVATEVIDLTGRTGPFSLRARLAVPDPLVKVTGDSFVDFRAAIQEAVISRRFESVPLTVIDLPPGLRIRDAARESGSVQVQGTQLAVESMTAEQVQLVLDCSTIHRPGVWRLSPRAEVPSTVSVVDWTPRELSIEFVAGTR
jgi:YbbR domain-containing protein